MLRIYEVLRRSTHGVKRKAVMGAKACVKIDFLEKTRDFVNRKADDTLEGEDAQKKTKEGLRSRA